MADVVLDSGALIAADRNDRRFWAVFKRSVEREDRLVVPSPVLAQVWRGGTQARLGQLLKAAHVDPLFEPRARDAGVLLGESSTEDIVDAVVVVTALERDSVVVTSDADDLRILAAVRGRAIGLVEV